MSLRQTVLALAQRYQLEAHNTQQLVTLSGLNAEPANISHRFWKAVMLVSAGLFGLGLMLWIAANWQSMGRVGHFVLLQALVALLLISAWRLPKLRLSLSFLSVFAIGGLFAYFGQTYQTGADPWQLFALWAALLLPLCLANRHDALWLSWVVIAYVGFWLFCHVSLGVTALPAWLGALCLAACVSPALRAWTGAGQWAFRMAMTLCTLWITASSASIWQNSYTPFLEHPFFWLSLAIFSGLIYLFSRAKHFDIYVLCLLTLCQCGLFMMLLFERFVAINGHENFAVLVLRVIVFGLIGIALMTFSIKWIMRLQHHYLASIGTAHHSNA